MEGTARVLAAADHGHLLQSGEVLVTSVTNVGWTPIFPRAAAIVTDVGAPLSHAAIVARELGLPAVVGCGNATMRIRTGDRVRVDGSAGVVEVLGPEARGREPDNTEASRLERPPDRRDLSAPVYEVAPRLLGAVLRHGPVAVRLVEVEAYDGSDDPASHAFRGRTARNAVMFGPAGHLYVYFSYGMHWCANVICGPDGTASGALLRAGEVIAGLEEARSRRGRSSDRDLARGPGRLTQALGMSAEHKGVDLFGGGPVSLEPADGPRRGQRRSTGRRPDGGRPTLALLGDRQPVRVDLPPPPEGRSRNPDPVAPAADADAPPSCVGTTCTWCLRKLVVHLVGTASVSPAVPGSRGSRG